MFYPTNFPKDKEKILLNYLACMQTGKPLLKLPTTPPRWQLNFVLIRHRSQFSTAFIYKMQKQLVKTKVRSWSGIVPVSVFTAGVGCPFNCAYCANEPTMPKSYFSDEPAVMRAIRNDFDPFKQVFNRLQMLYLSGHPIDKIELIIQGGTFSFYDRAYRTWFVQRCFDAANTSLKSIIQTGKFKPKTSASLLIAQRQNEKAPQRIIGLTIETRPDFIDDAEINFLRYLGVTRLEIGVQAPNEKILKLINRGHGLKEIVSATKLLKNAGFKITYHLMPGLPGTNPKKDLKMLEEVFTNPDYKPDNIKFYPTSVVKYSKLADWYRKGKYQPYDEKVLSKLVVEFKKRIVPPWLRIQRLVRDLTVNDLVVNAFPSNLRQKIALELKTKKIKCQCIRCREIKTQLKASKLELVILNYAASGGQEYFLQYVDSQNRLYALLRLRIFAKQAVVRELHVYGKVVPLGARGKTKTQHTGLGKKLLRRTETIVRGQGIKTLSIIAGIGAREYYRMLGYRLKDTYMVKSWQ